MSEKTNLYNIFLLIVIVLAIGFLLFQNVFSITGNVTESTTVSNVTIQKYLSLALCSNLSEGISFGDVSALPAVNLNGTHNYDAADTGTSYCVNVSEDGNTAIDVCIRADGAMTSVAADEIGLGNETYGNWSATNASLPHIDNETSLTTGYLKSGINVGTGELNYYRFWLDIPAAQPSGSYNNTIYFKGVQTTTACGA